MADARKWLGINWEINLTSGWGILGLNLAEQAELNGRLAVVPLAPTGNIDLFSNEQRQVLAKVFERERVARLSLSQDRTRQYQCAFPVIQGLGNRLVYVTPGGMERIGGTVNLAIVFFEDTQLGEKASERSKKFERIFAGSNWNTHVLRKNGISNVATFLQGVDLSRFNQAQRPKALGNRFMVFSGGKLEYRKAQDIAVAAFREFYQKHPDAVLVTVWYNPLPATMATMHEKGHVHGSPVFDHQRRADIAGWLEANGIPRSACYDVGSVPNNLMPDVYSQVDVAVFPNRCEGGTNLVAMECLACGVPTILSANTGHLDLVDERHCYPLVKQGPVQPVYPFQGTEGWGESDVDETVEMLERVYSHRQEAQKRGAAAARFMQDWSWKKRFEEFVKHLEAFS